METTYGNCFLQFLFLYFFGGPGLGVGVSNSQSWFILGKKIVLGHLQRCALRGPGEGEEGGWGSTFTKCERSRSLNVINLYLTR